VPVQVLANRLRLRRDAALEAMLGAPRRAADARSKRRSIPEGGAYATHRRARGHGHHHHDGCGHDHHHDHAHGHDHDH
jgi:hypothetical protein